MPCLTLGQPAAIRSKSNIAISFYSKSHSTDTVKLLAAATAAAHNLNQQHIAGVQSFTVKDPYKTLVGPDGQPLRFQQNFDRLSFTSAG